MKLPVVNLSLNDTPQLIDHFGLITMESSSLFENYCRYKTQGLTNIMKMIKSRSEKNLY